MHGIVQNKTKRKKGKSKISFDEELITKDHAKQLVSEEKELLPEIKENDKNVNKRKRNKKPAEKIEKQNVKKNSNNQQTLIVNNSEKIDEQSDSLVNDEEFQEVANTGKKQESHRALKRKKHAEIIETKKMKVELELQQKSLNYLSKWKHNKSEWKFEKLRQVWIQQNLFDRSKIPDEFWETSVQYFSGAKGHSRKAVLELAIKYIEEEDKSMDENEDYQVKLKRARDIVQNLE